MKTTEAFKAAIERYIISFADSNPLFAAKACNPSKNLDDCTTFILNQVQKSGINGFTDEEIYSMAVHYYEEEDIDVGKEVQCQVVVNHQVELTPEEIAEQREKAKEKVFSEEASRIRSAGKRVTQIRPVPVVEDAGLLFSFD